MQFVRICDWCCWISIFLFVILSVYILILYIILSKLFNIPEIPYKINLSTSQHRLHQIRYIPKLQQHIHSDIPRYRQWWARVSSSTKLFFIFLKMIPDSLAYFRFVSIRQESWQLWQNWEAKLWWWWWGRWRSWCGCREVYVVYVVGWCCWVRLLGWVVIACRRRGWIWVDVRI